MASQGYDVSVVSSPGDMLGRCADQEGIAIVPIPMRREFNPVSDIRSLMRLCLTLRKLKPSIVHAHTPKAALLGMAAAAACRVPVRVFQLHGLVSVAYQGHQRLAVRAMERLTCALSTRLLAVSPSLRRAAITIGMPPSKIGVIGSGSLNGIDTSQFRPPHASSETASLRKSLGLPPRAAVIGYVGRLARDKGMRELVLAWLALRKRRENLHLLVVGNVDERQPLCEEDLRTLRDDPRVRLQGFMNDPSHCYRAMDVLVLPTYREGLGMAALEASASALPVVASDIDGCRDAVIDQVTGTLVPPRDSSRLASALERYLDDEDLRICHGAAGRKRVVEAFNPKILWRRMNAEYERLLGSPRLAA